MQYPTKAIRYPSCLSPLTPSLLPSLEACEYLEGVTSSCLATARRRLNTAVFLLLLPLFCFLPAKGNPSQKTYKKLRKDRHKEQLGPILVCYPWCLSPLMPRLLGPWYVIWYGLRLYGIPWSGQATRSATKGSLSKAGAKCNHLPNDDRFALGSLGCQYLTESSHASTACLLGSMHGFWQNRLLLNQSEFLYRA